MMSRGMRLWQLLRLAAAHATMAASGMASDFENYAPAGSFLFPTIATLEVQGPVMFDNLSDGRLLAVSTLSSDPSNLPGTPKLYLETTVRSRQFELLGDLPLPGGATWSPHGGAFLAASPGGAETARIAVGNNQPDEPLVGVFREADLLAGTAPTAVAPDAVDWYALPHFDAAWYDDRSLAINVFEAGTSRVELLDTNSPSLAPVHPILVDGIAGASAGVGFNSAGDLVTANGFSTAVGGSETGDIKSFAFNDWQHALMTGTALQFETQGTLLGNHLSGGSLVFDREDNLLVGGGDVFGGGQLDFFALVPAPANGTMARHFDPNQDATSSYLLEYNEVTREVYANEPFAVDFPPNIDPTRVYVYSPLQIGDMDCDGDIDFDDIDDLVLGLTDPDGYAEARGIAAWLKGDTDQDGDLDFDDIADFVELLTEPTSTAAVPEPRSWILMILALGHMKGVGSLFWVFCRRMGWILRRNGATSTPNRSAS